MLIRYARVSTQSQSLHRQIGALNGARVDRIFREKATAKTVMGRPQLEKAISGIFCKMPRLTSTLLLCVAMSFAGPKAHADLAGLLGIDDSIASIDGMLEQRLDQFFTEFNDSAKELLASGTNDGQLLLVQAGNQMNMTSITAAHVFRSELEKPIRDLSDEAQAVVAMMHTMRLRVEAGLPQGISLTDMLLINVERILDEANPLAENSLYIHRVLGLVVPPRENAIGHQLTLRGPEFGSASQGRIINFELSLDDQVLDVVPTSGGLNTDAVFIIPKAVLDGYRYGIKDHSTQSTCDPRDPPFG